ncbi:MAG: F0F1 ATP synthase subunit B [Candidatus Ruminococcus intestinipullorum]|nr:F0F1 ATP synthase subunit B [Candidatus Ruminococcus intestinipullorum]
MLEFNLNFLWTIINLIILFLLLRRFLINPVTEVMEKRKQMIAEGLQNAQTAQENAMKMKEEYEEALKGAREETVQMVEKARNDAKKEYDRILSEAGQKAGEIIDAAKIEMRIEREKTMNALQTEIAGLAMAAATKIITQEVAETENQKIYDQFLEEVGDVHESTDR